jgi:hypothetical protein
MPDSLHSIKFRRLGMPDFKGYLTASMNPISKAISMAEMEGECFMEK